MTFASSGHAHGPPFSRRLIRSNRGSARNRANVGHMIGIHRLGDDDGLTQTGFGLAN